MKVRACVSQGAPLLTGWLPIESWRRQRAPFGTAFVRVPIQRWPY